MDFECRFNKETLELEIEISDNISNSFSNLILLNIHSLLILKNCSKLLFIPNVIKTLDKISEDFKGIKIEKEIEVDFFFYINRKTRK
jgi:hypothetical protein